MLFRSELPRGDGEHPAKLAAAKDADGRAGEEGEVHAGGENQARVFGGNA